MQYLFLVVGGELESLEDVRFRDPEHLHFVGAFPTRAEATQAWRANAYQTVDNALMRYFVLPLHDLMESHRPLLKQPRWLLIIGSETANNHLLRRRSDLVSNR